MNWQQLLLEIQQSHYEGILFVGVLALVLIAIFIAIAERLSSKQQVRYNSANSNLIPAPGMVKDAKNGKEKTRKEVKIAHSKVEAGRAKAVVKEDFFPEALVPNLPENLLPKKLLIAKHGWTEELADLCKKEGLNGIFIILPLYKDFYPHIKQGYAELAQQERFMRLYISRLGDPRFDIETGLSLWAVDPDESALPALVELLGNRDEDVRMAAVNFLSQLKDKRTIPYLVGALMQPQRYVVARVVEVLVCFGNTAAIALSRLLPELSGQAQLTVLESLSVFPPTYPMKPIYECLLAPREQVRMFAARVFGESRCREAIPSLVEALNDVSWQVRAAAIKSLGQLGAIEAYQEIKKMEDDDAWYVRVNCKEALNVLKQTEIFVVS